MKSFLLVLTVNVMFLLLIPLSLAQDSKDPSSIPASSWESYSEGVNLALTLQTRTKQTERISALIIYLKNTSSLDVSVIDGANGFGFKIFTLDSAGKWQPLRDYDSITVTKLASVIIKPGDTLTYPVDLNQSELKLIKSRQVKCRIMLLGSSPNQRTLIESSAKNLTQ